MLLFPGISRRCALSNHLFRTIWFTGIFYTKMWHRAIVYNDVTSPNHRRYSAVSGTFSENLKFTLFKRSLINYYWLKNSEKHFVCKSDSQISFFHHKKMCKFTIVPRAQNRAKCSYRPLRGAKMFIPPASTSKMFIPPETLLLAANYALACIATFPPIWTQNVVRTSSDMVAMWLVRGNHP